jgi:hypothetical protein
MNASEQSTETPKPSLRRLSYVRIGESVDPETGEVSRTYNFGEGKSYRRVRGYVTQRWMRNHGWLP